MPTDFDEDERVAFRTVKREIAREFIFIPTTRHCNPISLLQIHVRPELSQAEFQRRLL